MNIGIDWLQFSLPEGNQVSATLDELNFYLPCEFKAAESGMLGYEHQLLGIAGARVLSTSRRPEHHVILPGKWVEAITPVEATCLLSWLYERAGNITRLDLAGDDTDKLVRPMDLKTFCEGNQLVTKFRTVLMHDNIMGGKGSTIYFGSAASARRLRVYDKDIESAGENDSVRWELQLRDEMASKCAEMILDHGINKTFMETLVGMVDFRDREKKTSLGQVVPSGSRSSSKTPRKLTTAYRGRSRRLKESMAGLENRYLPLWPQWLMLSVGISTISTKSP